VSAPPFAYVRAASLDDALTRLAEPGAVPLSGGQGLLPRLHRRELAPAALVDVGRLDELARLEWTRDGALRCGAAVSLRRLERDPAVRERLPGLVSALETVGTAAIRNRATLGGSLAQGDPGAVPAAMLAVAGAQVEIASADARRSLPAAAVAGGLRPGELLVAVEIPAPPERTADAWAETATRPGDRAELGVAARVAAGAQTGVACAIAGLSPRPLLAAAGALSDTPASDPGLAAGLPATPDGAAEPIAAALAAAVARRDGAGEDREGVLRTLLRRAISDAGAAA
jgi:carbon-monoxide dehydrogenase medium subunit